MGVVHACGSTMNYFIYNDRGKLIMCTTVKHPMKTELQNPEVQKFIRYFHAIMHAVIGTAVVIYLDDDNVFVYDDDPRDPMKDNDGEYYGFEKDLDVDEAVDFTSAETEEDTFDQYIGAGLQLPDKDGMKQTTRVCQILCDAYGNPEGNVNYRSWLDHTDHEIEFYYG